MQVIVLEEGAIPMNLVFAGYFCITVYSTTQKKKIVDKGGFIKFPTNCQCHDQVCSICKYELCHSNCATVKGKKQFKSNTTDKQNLIKLGKRIQFRQRTECAYAYVERSFFILRIDLIRSISPFPLASS